MSGPEETAAAARCWICSKPTYDPGRRERPWARAVFNGRQVLVCPACQADDPSWASRVDRCGRCGGTRLSAMLGEVVCRACGEVQASVESPREEFGESHAGA
jgi:hypothetical protein